LWDFLISYSTLQIVGDEPYHISSNGYSTGIVYMLVFAIESPRYYLAKGNIDWFIEGLRKLAKKND
jgi:hypothetical protein